MSTTVYDSLLTLEGAEAEIAAFAARHLAARMFSFASIAPLPGELVYALDMFVEDGYAALYGDWRDLAGRWMFKEHAAACGYGFPLEAREQVLDCLRALGEHGETRLRLGERFKANLDRHGHGHATTWCKAHWGHDTDMFDAMFEAGPTSIRIAFATFGRPNSRAITRYSTLHPTLRMSLVSLHEAGKLPKLEKIRAGKLSKGEPVDIETAIERVWGFRRAIGPAWLAGEFGRPVDEVVEFDASGRAFFSGTRIALAFARGRIDAGDTPEELAQRNALTPAHAELLRLLATRRPPTQSPRVAAAASALH